MKTLVPFRRCSAISKSSKSDVPSEVAHPALEGLRKFGKRFESYLLFRPFNVANIIPRQIGLFRQLLLTQTEFLPLGADGFPQNAINSARRCLHKLASKQNSEMILPTTSWYYFKNLPCQCRGALPDICMREPKLVYQINDVSFGEKRFFAESEGTFCRLARSPVQSLKIPQGVFFRQPPEKHKRFTILSQDCHPSNLGIINTNRK
jgi:hypothetical protein